MKPLSLAIGRRFSRARQRNRLVSFISLLGHWYRGGRHGDHCGFIGHERV